MPNYASTKSAVQMRTGANHRKNKFCDDFQFNIN